MADAFQPKFVDLVCNYTTSIGTGDFKLGPVVNGYTGFTAALQVGDTFYYSAIGLDHPNEREVGRGTLLANGVIESVHFDAYVPNHFEAGREYRFQLKHVAIQITDQFGRKIKASALRFEATDEAVQPAHRSYAATPGVFRNCSISARAARS